MIKHIHFMTGEAILRGGFSVGFPFDTTIEQPDQVSDIPIKQERKEMMS